MSADAVEEKVTRRRKGSGDCAWSVVEEDPRRKQRRQGSSDPVSARTATEQFLKSACFQFRDSEKKNCACSLLLMRSKVVFDISFY